MVGFGAGAGFEQPQFNDTGFTTGDAGFGTLHSYCTLTTSPYLKTPWPLNTDILVRKSFYLPPGATNLTVGIAVDNDVQVFLNGRDISGGLQRSEGCARRDGFVFSVPNDSLLAGNNVLAVRGHDYGGLSYLDMQVKGVLPTPSSTIIPYQASGYKYSVVSPGAGTGFEQPNFNDASFQTGAAAFGTALAGCTAPITTAWPLNTDLLVRKPFYLPPGARNLQVRVAVDNDVQVFINGHDVSGGLQSSEVCVAQDSVAFAVPDHVLQSGTNVLAVRGHDWGGASYLDVQVLGDLALAPDQLHAPEQCPCDSAHVFVGKPINTRTGNLWTSATDLTVTTPGPTLHWTRTYNSQATAEVTGALGPGWQHPFATHLILPAMPGGEAGMVSVLSPKGNRWRYRDLGNGQFQPVPGVYSTLAFQNGTYTLTAPTQEQTLFNTAGQATAMQDAQGRQLTLEYTPDGRLQRVVDAQNAQRFVELSYTPDGTRIATVRDGAQRQVQYAYDANGDLVRVLDVGQRPTTYHYQNHLLTGIDNALGQAVERTTYDQYTPQGKAIEQTLQDGQRLDLQYGASATTVTTTAPDGRKDVEEIRYDANNTVASVIKNGQVVHASAYGAQVGPDVRTDGNGNTTRTAFTAQGLPLRITDALGHTTQMTYDAHQRLTAAVDPLGRRTTFVYDDQNNLLRQTTGMTDAVPLGFTTVYTYDVQYPGKHWLEAQQTPDGVRTRYEYNTAGQVIKTTVGDGTPLAQVTTTEYDALGRLTATTVGAGTATAQRTVTVYNADNTIAKTIQNYKDGVFDPAHPEEDVPTTYGYDPLGRQVWVQDALGHYAATQYDAKGRMAWTARNLQASALDAQQQLPAQPPAYSPARPDTNVATFYGYDGLGRTTLVTETGILTGTFDTTTRTFGDATTRVTRMEYDAQSRPVTTTLNYRPDLPVGTLPDVNVQTLTRYDNAGNVTGQRDALGRWTVTEYDALNRPTKVIRNYENGDPQTVDAANRAWTDGTDTDLITITHYTADGHVERQIANAVDEQFTATEPLTDRITLYAYDAVGRPTTTTQNADPATQGSRTDTNRTTTTAYDATTGRVLGSQDALGRWVSQQYDVLGRVTTTVQNCRNAQGQAVAQGCAAFDAAAPDRNVPQTTHYDALGRAFETVDALGSTTRASYDGLGRATTTIQQYQDGQFDPAAPDTDVTTTTQYDALGRMARRTDAANAGTNQSYDGLGQTTVITDSAGRVTRLGYDGTGTKRWQQQPDGRLTVYGVDGLGRAVTTTQNYQNGVVSMDDPTDRDLVTRTRYDAGERRVQTVDAAGRVTAFGYDGRDYLVWVQENVRADCTSPTLAAEHKPCNVTTRYGYDRAGHRTTITDANQHTRVFTYTAADELQDEVDALGQRTTHVYDPQGQLVEQTDGRGAAAKQTLAYDGLGRLTTITAPGLAAPITQGYDAGGRRTSLTDATGTTAFRYDALGRITGVTAPQTGSVGYSYTARGERASLTYPDGARLDYAYGPDGQLKTVTEGATALASYRYDAAGRLQDVTRANGTVTTYGYDAADRVRDLRTTLNTTTLSQFQYSVDRGGQRTAVTEAIGGQSRTTTYGYDGLQRLTSATEQGGTTYRYAYDAVGNRTDIWVNNTLQTHRDYNAANQVVGWQYDQAGNLLNDGTQAYTYDTLNRLLTTTRGTTTGTNTYNGDGVLVAQASGSTTMRYAQDLQAPLSQVLATTQGSTTTRYVYGLERLASVSGTTRTWYGTDALGSVRQTLTDAGQPTSALGYDAWGVLVDTTSPAPFGFTGELQDAASGLVYLRARWYQSTSGRFLTRDVWAGDVTRPGSLHQYVYTENEPVNHADPSGLKRVRIWVAAFIAPAEITFPYVYDEELVGAPPLSRAQPLFDLFARFHGDDREFNRTGYYQRLRPHARQWHEVVIDTDRADPVVENASDDGVTRVTYLDIRDGQKHTNTGKANAPTKATVSKEGCTIKVHIEGATGNPLVKPSPAIDYNYNVTLDLLSGDILVEGQHDRFPWHEVYISLPEIGLVEAFDPIANNPLASPASLALPMLPITPKRYAGVLK